MIIVFKKDAKPEEKLALKQDFGYRRFQTRGKVKTETQFFLLAFAFNIEKLCNRIESKRFGKSLFDLKPA